MKPLAMFALLIATLTAYTTNTATNSVAPPADPHVNDGELTGYPVYGRKWPLTVDHGYVDCDDAGGVVFTTPKGVKYSVNGTAVDEHLYRRIDSIWADDPKTKGLKKELGPLIDDGLALC